MKFPIIIRKAPDTECGVTIPDFPDYNSAGRTLDEAISNSEGKPKRINISIPERLLTKFDNYHRQEKETISEFLAHVA